jgi:hypothetical protein
MEAISMGHNGKPISYNDSTLKTNMVAYLRLGNFNGNTGAELTDQTSNGNNATNVNSTPFVSELAVECNEAVYVPVYSIYYRTHDYSASFDPVVTITQNTDLNFASTQNSSTQNLVLIHVNKSDIDGKKLFWDVQNSGYIGSSTSTLTHFGLADGHLLGSDPSFVNDSIYTVPTVLDSRNVSQQSRYSNSLTVPDLSSFGNNITVIISFRKGHQNNPAGQNHTVYGIELRETGETLITSYDIISQPFTQDGTDGASAYGSLYEAQI